MLEIQQMNKFKIIHGVCIHGACILIEVMHTHMTLDGDRCY